MTSLPILFVFSDISWIEFSSFSLDYLYESRLCDSRMVESLDVVQDVLERYTILAAAGARF